MQEPIKVENAGNGSAKFTVKTRNPDLRVAGDYVREIYANMKILVDLECAMPTPNSVPGDLFSMPSMGSAVLMACQSNGCTALLAMEPVVSDKDLAAWVERVADYIATCSNTGLGLEIDAVWTCDSSKVLYGMMSSRGAGRMGFAVTKPLPNGMSINTLKNYVLKPGMKSGHMGAIARFYKYITNWTSSTWFQAEERFIDGCRLRETLVKLFGTTGRVPVNITAEALAVAVDSGGSAIRTVILPFPNVYIKVANAGDIGVRDAWVRDTMRDVWFQMVANVENSRGVVDYRPSKNMIKGTGIFAAGALIGGYTVAYPDWIGNTLGGMVTRLVVSYPNQTQLPTEPAKDAKKGWFSWAFGSPAAPSPSSAQSNEAPSS